MGFDRLAFNVADIGKEGDKGKYNRRGAQDLLVERSV